MLWTVWKGSDHVKGKGGWSGWDSSQGLTSWVVLEVEQRGRRKRHGSLGDQLRGSEPFLQGLVALEVQCVQSTL